MTSEHCLDTNTPMGRKPTTPLKVKVSVTQNWGVLFYLSYKLIALYWLLEGRFSPVVNDSFNYIWRIKMVMDGIPVYDPAMVYTYSLAGIARVLGLSAFAVFELSYILGIFLSAFVIYVFLNETLVLNRKQVNLALFSLAFYSSIGFHSFLHYVPSTYMVLLVLLLYSFIFSNRLGGVLKRSSALFILAVIISHIHSSGIYLVIVSIPLFVFLSFMDNASVRNILQLVLPVILAVIFSFVSQQIIKDYFYPLSSVCDVSSFGENKNIRVDNSMGDDSGRINYRNVSRMTAISDEAKVDRSGLLTGNQALIPSDIALYKTTSFYHSDEPQCTDRAQLPVRIGRSGQVKGEHKVFLLKNGRREMDDYTKNKADDFRKQINLYGVKNIRGENLKEYILLYSQPADNVKSIPVALFSNDKSFSHESYLARVYFSFFSYFVPNKYIGAYSIFFISILIVNSLRNLGFIVENRKILIITFYWFSIFLLAVYIHPRGHRVLEMVFPLLFIILSQMIYHLFSSKKYYFCKLVVFMALFLPLFALNYCFAKTENYTMKSLRTLDDSVVKGLRYKPIVTNGGFEKYFLRAHYPFGMIDKSQVDVSKLRGKEFNYVILDGEIFPDYSFFYAFYRQVFPKVEVKEKGVEKWLDDKVKYVRINRVDNMIGVYRGVFTK